MRPKKVRWYSHDASRMHAMDDVNEQIESPDGSLRVLWEGNRGIYNDLGWLYQGFIEAADGSLRPQSYEETAYCYGCHAEIGRTTDGIFSFPRRLGPESFAKGWFHWTQHDLRSLPEPRSGDGQYEYTRYLRENGAGDELTHGGSEGGRWGKKILLETSDVRRQVGGASCLMSDVWCL